MQEAIGFPWSRFDTCSCKQARLPEARFGGAARLSPVLGVRALPGRSEKRRRADSNRGMVDLQSRRQPRRKARFSRGFLQFYPYDRPLQAVSCNRIISRGIAVVGARNPVVYRVGVTHCGTRSLGGGDGGALPDCWGDRQRELQLCFVSGCPVARRVRHYVHATERLPSHSRKRGDRPRRARLSQCRIRHLGNTFFNSLTPASVTRLL